MAESDKVGWSGVRAVVGLVATVLVVLGASLSIFAWTSVQGIRNPEVDQLPQDSDAVMVFAGETGRFTLGLELVEAGVAPVLVLNAFQLPAEAAGWCEEPIADVEVICLIPDDDSTWGEAKAFGELANRRGWASVVGVTADYHTQRAKMLLERCFSGDVWMAQLDWGEPATRLVRSELLAFAYSRAIHRSC